MGTITHSKTLKRADALSEGDLIAGTSKYGKGEPVTWIIRDIQGKLDPVLGGVIQVNLHVRDADDYLLESHEIFLKPSDRIWVSA